MSLRLRAATALCTALLIAAVAHLSGCTPKGPTFVSSGSAYTTATVSAVFDRVDLSKLANTPVDEATTLRHKALTALRGRGADGTAAANLITQTLRSEARAVPVYVERATMSGKPALVVVEASGPTGGTLGRKRLWVFDEQGNVLFAGSR